MPRVGKTSGHHGFQLTENASGLKTVVQWLPLAVSIETSCLGCSAELKERSDANKYSDVRLAEVIADASHLD